MDNTSTSYKTPNLEEYVSDGSLLIIRIPVPGGFIYNSFDKENGIMGSVFVPITEIK